MPAGTPWAPRQQTCSGEARGSWQAGTPTAFRLAWGMNRRRPKSGSLAKEAPCRSPPRPLPLLPRVVQAKGAGYAISRDEELKLVADVALATGIVLDPV